MPAKGQDIMATSVFLARLLGPLLLAVGAGILINPKAFRTMASEVVRSVTLVYLFGLFDFAAGLAIVLTHNVWVANWRVLITILGWLMLIRGAVRASWRRRPSWASPPRSSGTNSSFRFQVSSPAYSGWCSAISAMWLSERRQ